MRRIIGVIFLAALFISASAGQVLMVQKSMQPEVSQAVQPIGGWSLLRADWAKLEPQAREYARLHPEGLQKTAAWGFTVGAAHTWWSTDIGTGGNSEFQVPATCRAVGSRCYIFVEDDQWGTKVTQEAVDSVEAAFDSRTPADATKGIYALDTQYYGNPPDVDNDPRIIILIMDIKDGYTPGTAGGYVAGYFYELNELPQSGLPPGRHSNHAEIYYIDCNPGNLSTVSGMTVAASTTAHEFQHMINYNYHGGPANPNQVSEITFINEGMSEAASRLCRYALDSPGLYFANTNVDFVGWSSTNTLPEYSRAALFSWYLVEQFGSGLTSRIVQNAQSVGIPGYNDSFQKMGSTLQFTDVLKNFAVAAGLNDATVDPRYGFTQYGTSLRPAAYRTYTNPNVSQTSDTLLAYGTRYITFNNGTSLSATFAVNGQASIQAIATGTAGKKVTQVTSNTTYTESQFGAGYDVVTFALTNLTSSSVAYQYTASGGGGASGPTELVYDDGNPEGYLPLAAPDTAAVWFDAVPGAYLDSIRVAFRRTGSLSFGVWKYTGSATGSPLGQNYGVGTIVSMDSAGHVPYPIPYPSWASVNVASWNVDLHSPFAVGFVFGTNGGAPGLMYSKQQDIAPERSLTYHTSSSNGVTAWYIFQTNTAGDSIVYYLVHAFVHYGTTGVSQGIELAPSSFELSQNYPNPFNPSTVIRYALPVKTPVRLVVYDMLGREVTSLVDQVQEAGHYEIRWNGTTISGSPAASGVYFYTLRAGTYTQTNKMLLLR